MICVNNKRRIILNPHHEKNKLWCWKVLEYSEQQDRWYCIGCGIEVDKEIAVRKAQKVIAE